MIGISLTITSSRVNERNWIIADSVDNIRTYGRLSLAVQEPAFIVYSAKNACTHTERDNTYMYTATAATELEITVDKTSSYQQYFLAAVSLTFFFGYFTVLLMSLLNCSCFDVIMNADTVVKDEAFVWLNVAFPRDICRENHKKNSPL